PTPWAPAPRACSRCSARNTRWAVSPVTRHRRRPTRIPNASSSSSNSRWRTCATRSASRTQPGNQRSMHSPGASNPSAASNRSRRASVARQPVAHGDTGVRCDRDLPPRILVTATDGLGAASADGDDVAGADVDRARWFAVAITAGADARTPGAATDGRDGTATDRHGPPVGAAPVEAAADTRRPAAARRPDRATADRHRMRTRTGLPATDAGARIPAGRVHLTSGDRDRTADRPGTPADAGRGVPADGGHPATGHDDRPAVRAQAAADARRAVAAGRLER